MLKCSEGALPALTDGRSRLAGIPPACCDFKKPRGNKPTGFQVLRRHKAFRKRLQYVRQTVQETGNVGPEFGWLSARISPTLTMWGVPEGLGGRQPPLGLSSLGNSQETQRRGLKGMPTSGRKKVTELLALLEEFRARLGFWHVTLPDEDYVDLRELKTWPVFQRRLFDRLAQYLKDQGVEQLMVGVCEIGELRLGRTGKPMPHLHIVTSGYNVKDLKGRYVLRPDVMDELVQKSCDDAGLPRRSRQASSRIEKIRYSVRGYVDKYVTKGGGMAGKCLDDGWDALIPHQWWNRSDGLHRMLQGTIFHLPPAFVAFVLRQRQKLEAARLGFGRVAVVGRRKTAMCDLPIEVECFRFWNPESLLAAWELFHWWLADPDAWLDGGAACSYMDELASHNGNELLPVIPLDDTNAAVVL